MDNLPGYISCKIAAISNVSKCIINSQSQRVSMSFIQGFSMLQLNHNETTLKFSCPPKRKNGLVLYEHQVSIFIPLFNMSETIRQYLNKCSIKGCILQLTDSENIKWISGSLDVPLELDVTDEDGESGTGNRGVSLSASGELSHSKLKFFEL